MSGNRHIAPWEQFALKDWDICGMNHYYVNDEKLLYVSMTKDGRCIKAEGKDTVQIWNILIEKAAEI